MQYGLIGERLGHSYSREIHERIADYRYELKELAPEEVGAFLRAKAFCGINVTIPYKETVIPYLDEISEDAARIGAVNTIVHRDGKLYGYNTDFSGMCALLSHAGIRVSGKKALVLGTGGTSKTARAVLASLGAKEILTVSRKPGNGVVTYEEAARLHADTEILVNTTPVGMFPQSEGIPVDLDAFPYLTGVADAVYHPLRTNLVLEARRRGIPAEGGLYMLCAQAVYASAYFQGIEPDPAQIDIAFCAVQAEKRNLVLIGMPTSGKTTVGRLIAAREGRQFVDTDDLVTERAGEPISEYIPKHGEEAFRALERSVIAEVSAKSGSVIATGGGAVLDPGNVRLLARDGILVFLDRSPEKLIPAPDRPLSSSPEKLRALYEKRYPVYRAAADLTVPGDGTPEEVADAVGKELGTAR